MLAITLLLSFIIFSTSGYMIVEGWGLLDALYMTIITMTSIGYGEVKPLSNQGRIFTIVLIIIGVVVASYSIKMAAETLLSEDFLERIRKNRRQNRLDNINGHCIICGYGRLGRSLAKEMRKQNVAIIVIDLKEEFIQECHNNNIPAVTGNASDEHILEQAGIDRAKSLVAGVMSDADNVFIVLTAKSMNPKLTIISRYNLESSIPKLKKAGADTVISPYTTAGQRIAHKLIKPNVLSFLDGILDFGDKTMRLEEFIIDPNSPLAGKTLKEAQLNVAVLAVTHPTQTVLAHANANTILMSGSAMIVMGVEEELNKVAEKICTG